MASALNSISSQLASKLSEPSLFTPSSNLPMPGFPPLSKPSTLPPSIYQQNTYKTNIPSASNYSLHPPSLENISGYGHPGSLALIPRSSATSIPTAKFPSHLHHGSVSYLEPIPVASALRQPIPMNIQAQVQPPSAFITQTTDDLIGNPAPHMIQSLVTRPVILNSSKKGLRMPETPFISQKTYQPTKSYVIQPHGYVPPNTQPLLTSQERHHLQYGTAATSGIQAHDNDLYGSIAGTHLLNSLKGIPDLPELPGIVYPSNTDDVVGAAPTVTTRAFPVMQTQGGLVTVAVTGPTRTIGHVGNESQSYCPWWVCSLLGLVMFVLGIGACYSYFALKRFQNSQKYKKLSRRQRRKQLREAEEAQDADILGSKGRQSRSKGKRQRLSKSLHLYLY